MTARKKQLAKDEHLCPVCNQPVGRTNPGNNIVRHLDTAGNTCAGSHEPWRITVKRRVT